jgi:hypothetical protein
MRKEIVHVILLLVCCGLLYSAVTNGGVASGAETKKNKKSPVAAKAKPKTAVKASAKESEKKETRKFVAYYFHGTARCASCKAIEANSAEAINKGFEKELKDGTLEWKPVNVEEKGNEHFVQDYKLYTKSLILSEVRGGKQTEWKNLDKVWELLQDKEAFVKYVQEELRTFMAEK